MYAVHRLPEKLIISIILFGLRARPEHLKTKNPLSCQRLHAGLQSGLCLVGDGGKRVGENKYGLRKPQTTTLDHRQPHQKELETL